MTEPIERLRRRIIASGMGPREVERASGVSASVVSRFVRGHQTLTVDVAARLAEALGYKLALVPKPKRKGKAVRHGKRGV